MHNLREIEASVRFDLGVFLLTIALAAPVRAYDFPLSPVAIREAYFLGRRQPSLGGKFLAQYTQAIPNLRAGAFVSEVRIETPFFHVALLASKKLEYSAQDALIDFQDKPLPFLIFLDVCYKSDAPPRSVKIRVIQNKKELLPLSADSSPFYPATDKRHRIPSVGEKVQLELNPGQLGSSDLTILIDTPDGQHAETQFDLAALR